MKLSRFQIGLAVGLLALIGALGMLQVIWLGRISEAEKDRMTRRLQSDSQRFAEDFNRELTTAYSSFQTDSTLWQRASWREFADRDAFWRGRTAYPDLIREFYYVPANGTSPILRYDRSSQTFVAAEVTDEIRELANDVKTSAHVKSVDPEHAVLRIQLFDDKQTVSTIVFKKNDDSAVQRPTFDFPKMTGVLILALNEEFIQEKVFPDLVAKHFPDGDFRVSVSSGDKTIFGSVGATPDFTAPMFALTADNMIFVAGRDGISRPGVKMSSVIVNQSNTVRRFETRTIEMPPNDDKPANMRLEVRSSSPPELIRTTQNSPEDTWKLNVTHASGSVEAYASSAKWRNLGVTFGILTLLTGCVLMIFISTRRARLFAQRQVDFVSSVSHEFRTPLAVIFSAGENLADGVAAQPAQVERYGLLIKNEGRKLSQMVEQILEFAGANSGRRKLELGLVSPADVLETALADSRALLNENDFVLENQISPEVSPIRADAVALSRALQNLIANAVKYSNGSKWLRVGLSAVPTGAEFRVEDRGFGIDRKDLPQIFEPFYRARSVVDRQISGNGLGLSIVSDTVCAHGGEVTVESETGQGSVFKITIPFAGRETS